MTVIAYRDGVMAADTMAFIGDRKVTASPKILRVGAVLFGSSGDADKRTVVDLLQRHQRPDDMPGRADIIDALKGHELQAIVVFPSRRAFYLAVGVDDAAYASFTEVNDAFVAVGAGAEYAIGAMAMGASPQDAVRVAINHCSGCGGRVQVEVL